ncbi:MAG: hypothetical protein ACXAB7_18125 [Candidatus Kariarchaeaceae archaeon]|jgi:hypothetical protein
MLISKTTLILGITLLLLVFPTYNSTGNSTNAFSGSISTDVIEKGSIVRFTGSVYNQQVAAIWIYSMNVSFMETFGRSKEFHNTSKFYGDDVRLATNDTFTDVISAKIEYEPGKYNVSIFFDFDLSGKKDESAEWNSTFALANSTVEIVGVGQPLEIARGFGIVLGSITGIIVLGLVYTKIKK